MSKSTREYIGEFKALQSASYLLKETKDCGVKAFAVVTGLSYYEAHSILTRHGRKRRKGTPNRVTYKCLELLGFKHEQVWVKSKTVRTLEREMKRYPGSYLVWVSGGRHILAIKDGKVIDWTGGRMHRIHRIEKITYVGARELQAANNPS